MIRKAFKFRIYPDREQAAKLDKQFGYARFVYNHYRAVREGYYQDTGTGLTYNDCATDLSERLKVEHPWLKDADSQAVQQALMDLDKAYKNFFEGRAVAMVEAKPALPLPPSTRRSLTNAKTFITN